MRADYDQLYDQAGLMVRLDERHWVKTGRRVHRRRPDAQHRRDRRAIGLVGERARRRSARPVPARDRGQGCACASRPPSTGGSGRLLRLAPFPGADRYLVGPMCCTPERAGLVVEFSDFTVAAPTTKDLHDLS